MQLVRLDTGRILAFERKKSMMSTGVVYEINTSEDGNSLSIGSPKYIGQSDDPRVIEWQAEQAAFNTLKREKQIEKKMATDTWKLDKHIEALAMARIRLAANQRLPFDLWLLNQIR